MADANARERALTRLRAASARVKQHDQERDDLAAAIVDALKAGVRPRDIAEIAPYDRNHIRRIAKAAGVPPLREPTVQPRSE
jgi:hypothetical protein